MPIPFRHPHPPFVATGFTRTGGSFEGETFIVTRNLDGEGDGPFTIRAVNEVKGNWTSCDTIQDLQRILLCEHFNIDTMVVEEMFLPEQVESVLTLEEIKGVVPLTPLTPPTSDDAVAKLFRDFRDGHLTLTQLENNVKRMARRGCK